MPKKTKKTEPEPEIEYYEESSENPGDIEDSSNRDSADSISDISMPRSDDSSFSLASLEAIREEKEREKQSKGKRGRKPGSGRKSKSDKKKELIQPIFMFANGIMKSRGIEPLSKEEMDTGVEAWYPLIDHYAPKLEKYSMWLAPLAWTTGVVMIRMNGPVEPIEVIESATQKERVTE